MSLDLGARLHAPSPNTRGDQPDLEDHEDDPLIANALVHLQQLLSKWNSRYRCSVKLEGKGDNHASFITEWCRRPTPIEPQPPTRVELVFIVQFEPSDTKFESPRIVYRVVYESLVHEAFPHQNIDHHIMRALKFKIRFFNQYPFRMHKGSYFDTRYQFEQKRSHRLERHVRVGTEEKEDPDSSQGTMSEGEMESFLIRMFQEADVDNSGYLDPEEFARLLFSSKCGLSTEDVTLIMTKNDLNSDGKIVYREFIPVAVDLLQCQKAAEHAHSTYVARREAAETDAIKRVRQSSNLHHLMDEPLQNLPRDKNGFVHGETVRGLLAKTDLQLTSNEIEYVMMRCPSAPHDALVHDTRPLESSYEALLIDAIIHNALDQQASNVELYMKFMLAKMDHSGTGMVPITGVRDAFAKSEHIQLSQTQMHAVLRYAKGKPKDTYVDYRTFSRKAALMVMKLLHKVFIAEKKKMIARARVTPVELLSGQGRRRIEQQLWEKFREFDLENTGTLSREDFKACLTDTSLTLSQTEVNHLVEKADENHDGSIDLEEFMKFAYEELLVMAREATLHNEQVSLAIGERTEVVTQAGSGRLVDDMGEEKENHR